MTTLEDRPTVDQRIERADRMAALRSVLEIFADPVIALPYELDSFSIQVRSALHRCQVEAALIERGFGFGEDYEYPGGVNRPVVRLSADKEAEFRVGRVYGPSACFVLSDQATVDLLDAVAGEPVRWEHPTVAEVEDVTGDVIPALSHHRVRMPAGWRAQSWSGGAREFVEPVYGDCEQGGL